MNISLRAGDKLYLNGAVIQVDRKVSIELLNKVKFLLGTHVLQAAEANTPLRQVYFVVQTMLMDPSSTAAALGLARKMILDAISVFGDPSILSELKHIDRMVSCGNCYEAMKSLRALFEQEREIMFPGSGSATSNAA